MSDVQEPSKVRTAGDEPLPRNRVLMIHAPPVRFRSPTPTGTRPSAASKRQSATSPASPRSLSPVASNERRAKPSTSSRRRRNTSRARRTGSEGRWTAYWVPSLGTRPGKRADSRKRPRGRHSKVSCCGLDAFLPAETYSSGFSLPLQRPTPHSQ